MLVTLEEARLIASSWSAEQLAAVQKALLEKVFAVVGQQRQFVYFAHRGMDFGCSLKVFSIDFHLRGEFAPRSRDTCLWGETCFIEIR